MPPAPDDVVAPSARGPASGRPDAKAPSALRDVLASYALAFVGTAVLGRVATFGVALPFGTLGDVAAAGTAALFFGLALHRARRTGGEARAGLALGGLTTDTTTPLPTLLLRAAPGGAREAAFALGLALVLFPPFAAAFWAWHVLVVHAPHHAFAPSFSGMTSFALAQVLVVAIPEEAFFRGFVQTRLGDRWPPRRFLGVDVHPMALVLQAALFALVHLAAEPRVEKLATFFPGLLFGWMRAKRGGIGASVVFHALSNVLADFLVRAWLA